MIDKLKNKNILFYSFLFIIVLAINIFVGQKYPFVITGNYFKLFNKYDLSKDIVIVAIDEETLNDEVFQQKEISRDSYAKVLKNILRFGPKAIGLDVFFNQKSNVILKSQDTDPDDKLREILSTNDNIIIANEFDEQKSKLENTFMGTTYLNFGYANTSGRKTVGITPTDTYRNIIPIYDYNKSGNPLRLKLYEKIANNSEIEDSNNYRMIGDKKIPIQNSAFNINFFGNIDDYKKNNNVISFLRLFYNSDSTTQDRYGLANQIKDKIVILGATAHDKHDEFYTPYDLTQFMPGVLLHANMLNTLLASKFLNYQDFRVYIVMNSLFLMMFIIVIARVKDNLLGALWNLGLLFFYALLSILSFVFGNYFIEIFPLIVSYFAINLILYVQKYLTEQKSKNEIKKVFGKYVSSNVVEEIIKVGLENLALGGTKKEITVFFSDLQGFTNISENLDPERLGKVLNIYLETMSNIILKNKGTIDKFIGDAIMCFWNAPFDTPNHPELACMSAILQRRALANVRKRIKEFGVDYTFDMRMGINTGLSVIGNFGSSNRHDYTALGDTVNLASRLESLCKYYGINLLISQNTFERIDESKFIFREIDNITVKGKHQSIRIYELIGFKKEETPILKNFLEEFAQGLNLYKKGDFVNSKIIFEKLADGPSKVFVARCENFINHPPIDFDGIYRFDIK